MTLSIALLSGDGIITTVAGDGYNGYSGDGGPAISASLITPYSVAVDASGNIYIADIYYNSIRMVTKSTGIITTVVGYVLSGYNTDGYSGDGGPATSARLSAVFGVAVDAPGNIYIADSYNHRIRLVTKSTGIITTVAGNGLNGYGYSATLGDGGPATSASVSEPGASAVDASGNIYIAECGSSRRIRLVTKSTGIITTVAGGGYNGYSGDGGLATSASLSSFVGVAVDASGNIYIAEVTASRIRMVTKSTGIITTVAGNGLDEYGASVGDGGPATSARLSSVIEIAVDASGNIYIADRYNNRIRLVTKSTGIISTVAGDGIPDYSGDGGLATSARLQYPSFIALDESGNIYISDTHNNRIRMVSQSGLAQA